MTDADFCALMQQQSDRICVLILHSDIDWVDVAIQENEMREFCRHYAPEKLGLFEMVYAARFLRLWETWRGPEPGSIR